MAILSTVGMCQKKNEFERSKNESKEAACIVKVKSCFEDKWMCIDAESCAGIKVCMCTSTEVGEGAW